MNMILERIENTSGTLDTGVWLGDGAPAAFTPEAVTAAVEHFRHPAYLVHQAGPAGFQAGGLPCSGVLPPVYPEWLGGKGFVQTHAVRYPYIAGAMARGIASVPLVEAMARAGMLAFFGSAGQPLPAIETALDQLHASLGGATWGCNLINSITDPSWEAGLVDMLLRKGVRRVSASAYMELTLPLVRYAFSGISVDAHGRILRQNYIFAKISRPDVARHFMAPAPKTMLDKLVARGELTAEEARLAAQLPVAEDYIVESDSGGHTDNQPLGALFPTILSLRERLQREHGYQRPIRIGAAGGLGTPASVAGAFSMGAEFVVTGSVNQATVEAGLAEDAKRMLCIASLTDFAMCPCADMFELGAKVQVLKRGSMFPVRASRLYTLYTEYGDMDDLPAAERQRLEKQVFRRPLNDVWEETRAFFAERNPRELERALADPKYRMALVFRWYLGKSSRWPIQGQTERAIDYQIWSGPAMGAFNDWVAGSFLEDLSQRTVVQIALNLLEGAAAHTRARQLSQFGISVPEQAYRFQPRPLVSGLQQAV